MVPALHSDRSWFSRLGDVRFRAEQCTPLNLVSKNEFNRAVAYSCVVAHGEKDARGRRGSVLWPVGGLGKLVPVWVPATDKRQPVSNRLFCERLFSESLGVVGSRAVFTDRIPLTWGLPRYQRNYRTQSERQGTDTSCRSREKRECCQG